MAENTKQRVSKKMLRIVETATELFTRFGIRRVTVEEICRKAGASKMTFYKYFPNKLELLKHIWNGWLDDGYRELDEINAMDTPFPEKLERIIEIKMALLSKWSHEFIAELVHSDPEIQEYIEHMKHENILRFMNFIGEAQEQGNIRKMRPEFFMAMLEKMQEVFRDGQLRNLYPNDLEFIQEIQNFFFFGVLPAQTKESR